MPPTGRRLWSAASVSIRIEARRRASHIVRRSRVTAWHCADGGPGEPRARYLPICRKGFGSWRKPTNFTSVSVVSTLGQPIREGRRSRSLPGRTAEAAGTSRNFELFPRSRWTSCGEQIDKSRPTRNFVIEHAEARLIGTYGAGAVLMPSKSKAYEILDELNTVCARCSLRAQNATATSPRDR